MLQMEMKGRETERVMFLILNYFFVLPPRPSFAPLLVPGEAKMSPGRASRLYGQPQLGYTYKNRNARERSWIDACAKYYFICKVFPGCYSPQ